jgi:broad specificity phosphatase PhoE
LELYFLRHGESQANADNVFALPDSPLTERGIMQAREASRHFDGQLDRIIVSPLPRAQHTAEIFVEGRSEFPPLETDARLTEYEVGSYGGRSRAGVTSRMLIQAEGAEDVQACCDRVFSLLRELQAGKARRVMLVSHSGVGHIILSKLRGLPLEEFHSLNEFPNATVVRLPL